MNNLKDKIKLVIIKENGDVDYIINNDDKNNVIRQDSNQNCMNIYKELQKLKALSLIVSKILA